MDPIERERQEHTLEEVKRLSSEGNRSETSTPPKNIFGDVIVPAASSIETKVTEQKTFAPPKLSEEPSSVSLRTLKKGLEQSEEALSVYQKKVKQESFLNDPNALSCYTEIMSKINQFDTQERQALFKFGSDLSKFGYDYLIPSDRVSQDERYQQASANLENTLFPSPANNTPELTASFAKTLEETRKSVGIIQNALKDMKDGNALLVYTQRKNELLEASNKITQSLGSMDQNSGAYNLAQADMMEKASMMIQAVQEDMNSLQGKISNTQDAIKALRITLGALALIGILCSCVPGGQGAGAALGAVSATVAIALGSEQVMLGVFEKNLADDQTKLAKDKEIYQVAATSTKNIQQFTSFMSDSISDTLQSVKHMAESFMQAMQAAEASVHEITKN